MVSLIDGSIKNYIGKLSSADPAPGGGSAAALTGALGSALTGMVGALTCGREKYAEHADFVATLLEQIRDIQHEFLILVDEDVAVFNAMSAAYRLPKNSSAEKAYRIETIQAALKDCTIIPIKVMELCLRALRLTADSIGKTNLNVLSDLGVAAACIKAAAQGAWLNVLINLKSLRDTGFASEHREKAEFFLNETLKAADDIYNNVERMLN